MILSRHCIRKNLLTSLMAIVAATSSTAVWAADVSGEKVEEVVRKAELINKDYPLRAVISGREATILTRRHSRATDDDLRIDAVLITKSVLDAFGSGIGTVKVLFRDEDSNTAKCVEVTANDIKAFAVGSLDAKKFLATIAVTKVGGDDDAVKSKIDAAERNMVVSAGACEEQRLLLMDRINSLRRKGTGVAPFEKLFADIDNQVKAGQEASLRSSIQKLNELLATQEDLVRQANRTGSGRGITLVSASNAAMKSKSHAASTNNDARAASADVAGLTGLSAADSENQIMFRQIKVEIFRRRSDPSASGHYHRKLNEIASQKNAGATSEQVHAMLVSLGLELGLSKDGNRASSVHRGNGSASGIGLGMGFNERQENERNDDFDGPGRRGQAGNGPGMGASNGPGNIGVGQGPGPNSNFDHGSDMR